MPQMAPLMWLNLFKFFLICFFVIVILTYFIKLPTKMESTASKISLVKLNWKW